MAILDQCFKCEVHVSKGQPFCGRCGTEIAAQTPPAERTPWGGDRLPADTRTLTMGDVMEWLPINAATLEMEAHTGLPVFVSEDYVGRGQPALVARLIDIEVVRNEEEPWDQGKHYIRLVVRPLA